MFGKKSLFKHRHYTLMHKNVPVVNITLDAATGTIAKVGTLYSAKHLPVSVREERGVVDRISLNVWWTDRCIPDSRDDVNKVLETLDIPNTRVLLPKSYALSLVSQYWVRPRGSDIRWEDVNFFTNDFSEDIGDLLFGKNEGHVDMNLTSPDNTADGALKKRWEIINGGRYLLKAGSLPFMQQPFNEVIATILAEHMDIPCVPYEIIWDGNRPYSICPDFIDEDTELVSAWQVMQMRRKEPGVSLYQHYLACCEELGVKSDVARALDQMIVLDYIIGNEDRHLNNFGLIRDANTLEWRGPAPIFDSGTALCYERATAHILAGEQIECKPFKKSHEEQLKLVTSFDWINFSRLPKSLVEMEAVLDSSRGYVDEFRKQVILEFVSKRIAFLKEYAMTRTHTTDDVANDVTKNTERSYGGA